MKCIDAMTRNIEETRKKVESVGGGKNEIDEVLQGTKKIEEIVTELRNQKTNSVGTEHAEEENEEN